MFNDKTAVGKAAKTLMWVVVSTGLVAGLSFIAGRNDLFNPTVVGLANVLLVLAKNLKDENVRNI